MRDHVYDALRRLRSVEFLGGGTDGRALFAGACPAFGARSRCRFSPERGTRPRRCRRGERALVAAPPLAPDPEADHSPTGLRAPLAERGRDPPPRRRCSPPCARGRRSGCASTCGAGTVEAARDELSRDGVETVILRGNSGRAPRDRRRAAASGRARLCRGPRGGAGPFGAARREFRRLAAKRGAFSTTARGGGRQGAGHRRPHRCRALRP